MAEEFTPNLAIISWLGTDAIQGAAPRARALRSRPGRSTSWAGTPHMHLAGTRIRVVLDRAAGGEEFAQDEPFSFENQRGYSQNVTRRCVFGANAVVASKLPRAASGASLHPSWANGRSSCPRGGGQLALVSSGPRVHPRLARPGGPPPNSHEFAHSMLRPSMLRPSLSSNDKPKQTSHHRPPHLLSRNSGPVPGLALLPVHLRCIDRRGHPRAPV